MPTAFPAWLTFQGGSFALMSLIRRPTDIHQRLCRTRAPFCPRPPSRGVLMAGSRRFALIASLLCWAPVPAVGADVPAPVMPLVERENPLVAHPTTLPPSQLAQATTSPFPVS